MSIRIVREAGVALISKPHFCLPEARNPFTTTADAEQLVEHSGRICYDSYGKGRKTNAEFIENIIASGHHSVLEHANWSVLITGVSRSLTHELVRHRHFSYSQLSQRYVDSSDVAFVPPPALQNGEVHCYNVWEHAMEQALEAYRSIESQLSLKDWGEGVSKTQRTKLARQAARSVLPNCTETKLVVTGNARAWRHFFRLRGSEHADVEIRNLAVKILELLKPEAPEIFKDCVLEGGFIAVEHAG